MQLINEDGEVQEGLEAVTMRDPDTNTLYVWSVFPNTPIKWGREVEMKLFGFFGMHSVHLVNIM